MKLPAFVCSMSFLEDTPTSINLIIDDEEGLPSPPVDEIEGALLAIQHVSMDLSGVLA